MPNKNRLLATLPPDILKSFLDKCEIVELVSIEQLNHIGAKVEHVYFPTNSLISLMHTVDGKSIETGLIGNDGMLGSNVFLGADKAICSAFVQISGKAYRLSTEKFLSKLKQSAALRILMSRYILVLIDRLSIAIGCHHYHAIENRLAYLLMIIQGSARVNNLRITQQLISNLLGVRRSSISKASSELQKKSIIQYSRGCIHILDPTKLEAQTCSCFKSYKHAYRWVEAKK